jgi:hypothetical protein
VIEFFPDRSGSVSKANFVDIMKLKFPKILSGTGLRCWLYEFFYNEPAQQELPRNSAKSRWAENNPELVQKAY